MIRILVPLDGSKLAEQALPHAIAIAQTFPAQLTFLRVIEESDQTSAGGVDTIDFALWRQQAQAYLSTLLEKYSDDDFQIQTEVAVGPPAETIIRYVATDNSDLLVLTRYGRGNAEEFAAGGTAQKIVANVGCSVLLLDPTHAIDEKIHYRRILVPVDERKDSDCAVALAAMIAEIHHASILLLNVTDEPRLPAGVPPSRDARRLVSDMRRLIRCEAGRRLSTLAKKIPPNIEMETRVVVSPDVSLAIESMAEQLDCDLLLLHAVPIGYQDNSRYDSVCQALVLHARRPMFILRAAAAEGLASNFRSVYLEKQRLEAG